MDNWKQHQARDPKKMLENLQNAVGGQVPPQIAPEQRQEAIGGGYSVTPSYDPDAEMNEQVAAQQDATVQQAGQDPQMAAKLAAFNQMIQQRNAQTEQDRINRLKALAGQ